MKLSRAGAYRLSVPFVAVVALAMAGAVFAQEGQVASAGGVTTYTQSRLERQDAIDFENAIAMPLPMSSVAPSQTDQADQAISLGTPGFERGYQGTGDRSLQTVTRLRAVAPEMGADAVEGNADMIPQEYGSSNHVFTTSRVNLLGNDPSKLYPYRAAGKLYFKIGTSTYVCSASLIKRGVIVTAAHCVADFGKSQFYKSWQFIPALSKVGTSLVKPYGTWLVQYAIIMTSYYNGSDVCYAGAPGVICQNDVAVLVAKPQGSAYPGTKTGWFGYGWDGWGFAPTNPKTALINQLGYPQSHDKGLNMQRTDSQGFVDATFVNNTVWGGRQTGGSSGGPELVNLGPLGALSGGVAVGTDSNRNIVVGVTSWGYTDQAVKQQGASPFLSSNIPLLVSAACGSPVKAWCK